MKKIGLLSDTHGYLDPRVFELFASCDEIWHAGDYPVVWTNRKFKMLYVNMGHNDMDYEHKIDGTNQTISFTFENEIQDRLVIDGLLWLGLGHD